MTVAATLTVLSLMYRARPGMRNPTGCNGQLSALVLVIKLWAFLLSHWQIGEIAMLGLNYGSEFYLPLSVIGSRRDKRRVCRASPGLAELSCMQWRVQVPICRHPSKDVGYRKVTWLEKRDNSRRRKSPSVDVYRSFVSE